MGHLRRRRRHVNRHCCAQEESDRYETQDSFRGPAVRSPSPDSLRPPLQHSRGIKVQHLSLIILAVIRHQNPHKLYSMTSLPTQNASSEHDLLDLRALRCCLRRVAFGTPNPQETMGADKSWPAHILSRRG